MMMAGLPGIQRMYFGGDTVVGRKLDCLQTLDKEWIQLILEAKSIGMDLNTIRDFLNGNAVKELVVEK